MAETEGFPLLRHNVFFSRRLPRPSSRTSSRHGRLPRDAHRLCLRPGPERRRDARSRRARAPALPRQRAARRRHPTPSAPRRSSDARQRTFGAAGALRAARCARDPERTVVTTPTDFDAAVPGDGGSALRPGVARVEGIVRAARRRAAGSGPLSGGRQRASGAGRADGGAVGPDGGREPARGPRFDQPVAPGRLCLVVRRRAERRRPPRPDHHRLHRQRVLALLRLGRRRGPATRRTTARSTSPSTAPAASAGP